MAAVLLRMSFPLRPGRTSQFGAAGPSPSQLFASAGIRFGRDRPPPRARHRTRAGRWLPLRRGGARPHARCGRLGCETCRPGQVEAAFEGDESAVEAMVDYCGRGPLGAGVRDVEVTTEPPAGETGFQALLSRLRDPPARPAACGPSARAARRRAPRPGRASPGRAGEAPRPAPTAPSASSSGVWPSSSRRTIASSSSRACSNVSSASLTRPPPPRRAPRGGRGPAGRDRVTRGRARASLTTRPAPSCTTA